MEEEGSENLSWQERIYWSHFQTTQFCQILPRDFNHHLVIPKKFARNMWHKLPRKALLKSPNGATWKVELKGDGDELRFLDGWGEFVKACSLKENDLLIFKYSGNSNFDVLIFNLESLCEKESVYFIR
ncbi:B3 domain-containing protein, partial [Drosera capensis]